MGEGTREMSPNHAEESFNDPEVERLVEDIEETRNDMTGTVEEIGDRLDPKHIVADARETVRNATIGKVEDMANTAGEIASEAGDTVREAGTGVIDMVTRNPIPAAMIGIGVGWLVMNKRNEPSWRRYEGANAGTTDPLQQARRRVDSMTTDVGHKVDDMTARAGQLADEVPQQVRSTAHEVGDTVALAYRANPLAIGAIAVAVGAAAGLALPSTGFERRTLAEPARKAFSAAEDVATDALGQAEQTARDAEEQALDEDRQARPH